MIAYCTPVWFGIGASFLGSLVAIYFDRRWRS